MATMRTISFTLLELDGLLDPAAEPEAAARAMDKIHRVRHGMPRKANPEPVGGRKRGPYLNLRRSA
mgnify:CR=1 FL=1